MIQKSTRNWIPAENIEPNNEPENYIVQQKMAGYKEEIEFI